MLSIVALFTLNLVSSVYKTIVSIEKKREGEAPDAACTKKKLVVTIAKKGRMDAR